MPVPMRDSLFGVARDSSSIGEIRLDSVEHSFEMNNFRGSLTRVHYSGEVLEREAIPPVISIYSNQNSTGNGESYTFSINRYMKILRILFIMSLTKYMTVCSSYDIDKLISKLIHEIVFLLNVAGNSYLVSNVSIEKIIYNYIDVLYGDLRNKLMPVPFPQVPFFKKNTVLVVAQSELNNNSRYTSIPEKIKSEIMNSIEKVLIYLNYN